MFNEELHRRLDAETEREIHVSVLESVCQSIHALCEERHWEEQEGLRRVIGAGVQALLSQAAPIQPVGDMPAEKRMQFLQDRWSEVDGA
ncbi:MAG: hypothetical protein DLM70_01740 [Chloroflexi bacterium]|nr:MAG: hypothetical protein DLM70_01740 [Chloroflexota bacterium]